MKGKTFLENLTNGQMENGLLVLMLVILATSFVESLGRPLLLAVSLIAPVAIGFSAAIVFHHIDQAVEYKACFTWQAHTRLAITISLLVGAVVKHLATQIPLIPYNELINAILLIIAPKFLFFLAGTMLTGLGYYLGWLETADERE